MTRPDKDEYYIEIAKVVASRSTCTRRKFGAVIVKNDTILSTGYNGSARGTTNCGSTIECLKDIHNEPSYKSYDFCPALHAEMNAILNAARNGISIFGATMFIGEALGGSRYGKGDRPCFLCRRFALNVGLNGCVYKNEHGQTIYEFSEDWIKLENEWMASK